MNLRGIPFPWVKRIFFEGKDRPWEAASWTGAAVAVVFGSNSQFRAIVEVYLFDDANKTVVNGLTVA